ncbi:MAG: branched-chain amino acid aminotransferase [Flavobacteriales bacterium]|nr:branched-chain amino acid aminotransferase [Flavobacteriales bacterium]
MLAENTTMSIQIEKTKNSRISEVDFNNIIFGRQFSDHMFVMDFKNGKWENPKIVPYAPIPMSPATHALHYGQSIFEGMKAYKNESGEVFLFRPEENFKRLNSSAERMCMPTLSKEIFMDALTELIKLDAEWIPKKAGSSLYVRPFMFATDEFIGVKPSENYRFVIFTCPVNSYYTEPVRVKIETVYSRACEGGVGRAKAAGNYAGALYPARLGQQEGYHQLVWTDAKEHKYIEESGTMNIMFVIGDKLLTPPTSGTILPGITRSSVLTIARDWGMNVEETSIHVDEVINALKKGTLVEAFGTGTAATIAHIQLIGYRNKQYTLPTPTEDFFSNKVSNYLEDLRRGAVEDKHNWIYKVM